MPGARLQLKRPMTGNISSLASRLCGSAVRRATVSAAVPDQNWVTLRWLDVSLNAGKPLVPIPEEHVECQPLPYQLPLPCMADIV